MTKKDPLTSLSSVTTRSSTTADLDSQLQRVKRRSFLKGLGIAGATLSAGTLLATQGKAQDNDSSGSLTKGDAAILRFLAAAEIIETDLWIQYNELGGVQDTEFDNFSGGNPLYTAALTILDGDMPQYIHDNTDDEISHAKFINAYLASKGAATVDLSHHAILPGSQATGANKSKKRITNLMNLNVDTSFWSRYRIDSENPDLDPTFTFPQAVKIKNRTAIPRTDEDTEFSALTNSTDHLKAIAFTAGFHFAFIEQGGTSLYPSLAQRVTSSEVLRILLSIGPTETAHFQTWQDKAGNATPLTDTDNVTGATVTFADLKTNQPESLQANLIMPEPCPFLSRKFPICSIIRPTNTKGAAMGAVQALTGDGLFKGQTQAFFEEIRDLAEDADAAQRAS
jgi:Ferritin-like domain